MLTGAGEETYDEVRAVTAYAKHSLPVIFTKERVSVRCNSPRNQCCSPPSRLVSVSKIVRDCCLRPAPHTLNLARRSDSFYFDICMHFGAQVPRPVILTDCIDPRFKLFLRPDGCPDAALITQDGQCCGICCNSQGRGAVLEWDGKTRLLKLIFSPCLPLCNRRFILRLRMCLSNPCVGDAGRIPNCAVLHVGCARVESNTVHVCPPACIDPCKPCCAPVCPQPCFKEEPACCPPVCPPRRPENILCFHKVDDQGCPLCGALFVLRDDCGTIVHSAVSNACGEVVFEDIPPGCYLLEEAQAPPGFRPTCRTFRVIVSAQGCIRVNNMTAEEFSQICVIDHACRNED